MPKINDKSYHNQGKPVSKPNRVNKHIERLGKTAEGIGAAAGIIKGIYTFGKLISGNHAEWLKHADADVGSQIPWNRPMGMKYFKNLTGDNNPLIYGTGMVCINRFKMDNWRNTKAFQITSEKAFQAVRNTLKSNLTYSLSDFQTFLGDMITFQILLSSCNRNLRFRNYFSSKQPDVNKLLRYTVGNLSDTAVTAKPMERSILSEDEIATQLECAEIIAKQMRTWHVFGVFHEYINWFTSTLFVDNDLDANQYFVNDIVSFPGLAYQNFADINLNDVDYITLLDYINAYMQTNDYAIGRIIDADLTNDKVVKAYAGKIKPFIIDTDFKSEPKKLNDWKYLNALINAYTTNDSTKYVRVDSMHGIPNNADTMSILSLTGAVARDAGEEIGLKIVSLIPIDQWLICDIGDGEISKLSTDNVMDDNTYSLSAITTNTSAISVSQDNNLGSAGKLSGIVAIKLAPVMPNTYKEIINKVVKATSGSASLPLIEISLPDTLELTTPALAGTTNYNLRKRSGEMPLVTKWGANNPSGIAVDVAMILSYLNSENYPVWSIPWVPGKINAYLGSDSTLTQMNYNEWYTLTKNLYVYIPEVVSARTGFTCLAGRYVRLTKVRVTSSYKVEFQYGSETFFRIYDTDKLKIYDTNKFRLYSSDSSMTIGLGAMNPSNVHESVYSELTISEIQEYLKQGITYFISDVAISGESSAQFDTSKYFSFEGTGYPQSTYNSFYTRPGESTRIYTRAYEVAYKIRTPEYIQAFWDQNQSAVKYNSTTYAQPSSVQWTIQASSQFGAINTLFNYTVSGNAVAVNVYSSRTYTGVQMFARTQIDFCMPSFVSQNHSIEIDGTSELDSTKVYLDKEIYTPTIVSKLDLATILFQMYYSLFYIME